MQNQHALVRENMVAESDLLNELAETAANRAESLQTEEQRRQELSLSIHNALHGIYQYFSQLFEHLNAIKPVAPRACHVDSRTAYSSIEWIEAKADLRKQSLSDNAMVDHVSLRIRLTAPESVRITRRWNELEKLSSELEEFGLRPVEDLYSQARRQPQKEFVEIELAPDFVTRMQFQGDYDAGHIELLSNNFDGFGLAAFVLKPADVTHHLLDEIGRFLLGRTTGLPELLTSTRFTPKYAAYR
jgi:hypothetical protein